MKDKISTLRKDYRDLKIFQNADDIASARKKLIIFVKKLIEDTNTLIKQIGKDFERNKRVMNRKIRKLTSGQDQGFIQKSTSEQVFDMEADEPIPEEDEGVDPLDKREQEK